MASTNLDQYGTTSWDTLNPDINIIDPLEPYYEYDIHDTIAVLYTQIHKAEIDNEVKVHARNELKAASNMLKAVFDTRVDLSELIISHKTDYFSLTLSRALSHQALSIISTLQASSKHSGLELKILESAYNILFKIYFLLR